MGTLDGLLPPQSRGRKQPLGPRSHRARSPEDRDWGTEEKSRASEEELGSSKERRRRRPKAPSSRARGRDPRDGRRDGGGTTATVPERRREAHPAMSRPAKKKKKKETIWTEEKEGAERARPPSEKGVKTHCAAFGDWKATETRVVHSRHCFLQKKPPQITPTFGRASARCAAMSLDERVV